MFSAFYPSYSKQLLSNLGRKYSISDSAPLLGGIRNILAELKDSSSSRTSITSLSVKPSLKHQAKVG